MIDILKEEIAIYNEDAICFDGFESAIIGMVNNIETPNYVVCYDYDKCIEELMEQGMNYHDAIDYFEFNVVSCYLGKNTPMFLHRLGKI